MNNTPNSIRDITDEEEPFGGLVINHYGIYNKADQKALNAYILGEVMELIGEDEPQGKVNIRAGELYALRNHLRQELRNKANKRFGELPSLYGVKAVIHEHAPDDTMTILPNPHKEQL